MKRLAAMIVILSALLSGCSTWLDGSYHSIKVHEEKESQSSGDMVAVSSYAALYRAVASMVQSGTASGVISVKNYNQLVVARDMRYAIQNVMLSDPIGAYAVEKIDFELGTNAGQPAIAVTISYYHDRTELKKIHRLEDMEQVEQVIGNVMNNCDSGIVLYVKDFKEYDFVQWVEDYSHQNADRIMETPQISVNIYPDTGASRVMELKFTYQNSRDSLRSMQTQVDNWIKHAVNTAKTMETQQEKLNALFTALTEKLTGHDTSITPSYSLLIHGVGDSKALATVYSAMCNRANLHCITVTGTYQGQPRCWNILQIDGTYFHVDLLRSYEAGVLQALTDDQMTGYVWDYSTYPVCSGIPQETE